MLEAGQGNKQRKSPPSMSPWPEPGAQRWKGMLLSSWSPGGQALANNLPAVSPEDPPHLRQPLMYLSLCPIANNQLRLADFSTFVREPAALAQLSICRKEAENQGKKKKKLLSHYSYSFPYSLPHPLTVSTAMPLSSSSSFFKNLFITIFPFMWREPLASVQ